MSILGKRKKLNETDDASAIFSSVLSYVPSHLLMFSQFTGCFSMFD